MQINKTKFRDVSIECPSCKANNVIVDGMAIFVQGFECMSCKYKTKTSEAGVGLLVGALLKDGRKIDAIKIYRAFTSKGLKESKHDVEAIGAKMGIEMKKGCFIATACYGSIDHEEVVTLRKYRDIVLSKHILGRLFIATYYAISPLIAKYLLRSERLKLFVRNKLLAPLVRNIKSKHFN